MIVLIGVLVGWFSLTLIGAVWGISSAFFDTRAMSYEEFRSLFWILSLLSPVVVTVLLGILENSSRK